ncbi:MAG: hypothetical protein V1724_01500 [Chloroflexota bacterium]
MAIREIETAPQPVAPDSGWSTDARLEIEELAWLRQPTQPGDGWGVDARLEYADPGDSNGWNWKP